jgi:hypothetical protein
MRLRLYGMSMTGTSRLEEKGEAQRELPHNGANRLPYNASGYPSAGRSPALPASVSPDIESYWIRSLKSNGLHAVPG